MGNDIRLAALVALLGSMNAANAVPSSDSAADTPSEENLQEAPQPDWV